METGIFLDDFHGNLTSSTIGLANGTTTATIATTFLTNRLETFGSETTIAAAAAAAAAASSGGSVFTSDNVGEGYFQFSETGQPHCLTGDMLQEKIRDPLIVLSVMLLVIINAAVIGGNMLVIVAVTVSSKLRTVTNFFIVSLAVSDLLLGIAVVPFSLSLTVLDSWIFGEIWCIGWLVIDVWLSTASILNLCAISVDRYLAVTRPVRYRSIMTSKRAKMIIAFVWILSFFVSFPPLVGWNDTGSLLAQGSKPGSDNSETIFTSSNGSECHWIQHQCVLFDNTGYVTYSALGSFYIPMSFMMFFYWRIYIVASRTTRALKRGYKTTNSDGGGPSDKRLTLRMHRGYICEDMSTSSEAPSMMSSGYSSDIHHRNHHHLHLNHHTSHTHHNNVNCTSFIKTNPKLSKSLLSPSKSNQGGVGGGDDSKKSSPSENNNINNNNNNNAVSSESHFGNNLCVPRSPGSGGGNKIRRKTPVTVYRSPRLAAQVAENDESVQTKRRSTSSIHSACSVSGRDLGCGSDSPCTRDSSGKSSTSKSVRFSRRTNTGKWQTKRLLAETKAAKTVGIIVGGFIICWFPFFTIYLIRGYCKNQNCIPQLMLTIFTWLGYANSAVNPIIYGLFSRDFRRAFQNIICKCKYSEETGVTSLIRQIHLPNLFEEDNHDDCIKTDSQDDVH